MSNVSRTSSAPALEPGLEDGGSPLGEGDPVDEGDGCPAVAEPTGLDAAGLDAPGLDAAGIDLDGLDLAGTEAAAAERDGEPLPRDR